MRKGLLLLLIPVGIMLAILLVRQMPFRADPAGAAGGKQGVTGAGVGSGTGAGDAAQNAQDDASRAAAKARAQLAAGAMSANASATGLPGTDANGDSQKTAKAGAAAAARAGTGTEDAAAGENVKPSEEEGDDDSVPTPKPSLRPVRRQNQEQLISQIYGDLFAQLNLSDEELARFKKMLLLKPQFSGSVGTEPEALSQTILSFLGKERYAVYQDYEATLPGRWLVGQYGQYLDSLGKPLSKSQADQLIQVVTEERKALPSVTSASALADLAKVPDEMAANLAKQEASNTAILARASTFLTQEQMAGLKDLQARRLANDQRSLEAYRQIFQGTGDKTPATTAPGVKD